MTVVWNSLYSYGDKIKNFVTMEVEKKSFLFVAKKYQKKTKTPSWYVVKLNKL